MSARPMPASGRNPATAEDQRDRHCDGDRVDFECTERERRSGDALETEAHLAHAITSITT